MTTKGPIGSVYGGEAFRPFTDAERAALAEIDLFCVLFSNRSGSTLLCDSLYRRGLPIPPQVEILDPSLIARVSAEAQLASFTDYFLSTVLGWASSGVVGFKAGASQLAWLDELGYLDCFRSLRLISISRRDKVGQAVSLYLAQQSGQWHSGMQSQRASADVPYDAARIRSALDAIATMETGIDDFARARELSVLAVVYEELLENPEEVLSRCCKHIAWTQAPDPDFRPAVPALKKQATALNDDYRKRFLAEA